MSLGRVPTGVLGLLVDQQYGLLVYAPVFAVGLAGLVPLARRHPRLTAEWAAVVVPYTIVTAMYHMWWGGFSSPARFIGATLPLFALPMAAAWASGAHAATRTVQAAALGVSAGISAMLLAAERGAFAFNTRDVAAPWLAWASQMADLTRAVPSLFRHGPATALAEAAAWIGALTLAWLACRSAARIARLTAGAAALVTLLSLGVAASAAVAISWRIENVSGVGPTFGQLRLLDAASVPQAGRAVVLDAPSFLPVSEALGRMRIGGRPADQGSEPPPVLPYLPAGRYRLWAELARPAEVEIGLISGRSDRPFQSWRVAAEYAGALSWAFNLPVGVSAVLPRVNAEAKAALRGLWLQPDWEAWRPGPAAGRRSVSARRYGEFVVYAIAGAWLEPDGLWTAGNRISELVVQAPAGETHARFTLRAGPLATPIYVAAGDFELKSVLAPGDVRELALPLSADGSVRVLIHAVQGFRPSEIEPGSTDQRVLGVRLDQNRTTPPK